MSGFEAIVLIGGGLAAGFMNTVAGGGSMLTLPLLMLVGLPPDVANGTNRVAIFLQNAAATGGFRSQGVRIARTGFLLAIPACFGALAGAWLAVSLDPSVLKRVFGVVLAVLAVVVLIQPKKFVSEDRGPVSSPTSPASWCVFFGIGVWGGFVQAGVGFLFLFGLVLWMGHGMVRANAIKVFVVLLYTAVALGVFLWEGKIAFLPGLVLAVGNMGGGYAASIFSVKKGAGWVRGVLVVCAVAASLNLLGVF